MSNKILYYLGAGASAYALPIAKTRFDSFGNIQVRGLPEDIRAIEFDVIFKEVTSHDSWQYIAEMKKNFLNLYSNAKKFGDVDTYAKFLYIMQKYNEFHKLKQTLSQFFSLRQVALKSIDSRYLPWLVSLMDRKQFPNNIKIVSWNYDYQIQLAAAQIGEIEAITHRSNSFNYSQGLLCHYPNLDPSFSDYLNLSLIHMNGVAGYFKEGFVSGSIFQPSNAETKEAQVNFMKNDKLSSQLHFAWEKGDYLSNLMTHALHMVDGAEILVVIGYSFPFFNREVDKQIINLIVTSGSLKKIYYQDPVLDGEQLRSQFDLPEHIKIVHIKQVENFHVPFEY